MRRAQGGLRNGVHLNADDPDWIDIGSVRVSRTQFALFAGEAHLHLGMLKGEHETLKGHGIITDAMLEAVHGLAAIADGVQLSTLQHLCAAFDQALQVLAIGPLSEEEEGLVGEAVEAVEQRVEQALALEHPEPSMELVDRLEELCRQAGAPGADSEA